MVECMCVVYKKVGQVRVNREGNAGWRRESVCVHICVYERERERERDIHARP